MDLHRCMGGCVPLFLLAVGFDVLGFVLLFVGIFANVRINGVFYGDFLIYTGSLVIFMSLGFWVMWYVWNIPVSDDCGLKNRSSVVVQLARKLTERLSQKLKSDDLVKCVEDDGRVTWGKSTAFLNQGYDDSLDSQTVEKKVEKEEQENQP